MKEKIGAKREKDGRFVYVLGGELIARPTRRIRRDSALTNGGRIMGEVKVKVKLTNAGDEVLVRRTANSRQSSRL